MATRKTKPKCSPSSTACGYACITSKKQCSSVVLARDAAELIKVTTGNISAVFTMPSAKSLLDKDYEPWLNSLGLEAADTAKYGQYGRLHDLTHLILESAAKAQSKSISDVLGETGLGHPRPSLREELFVTAAEMYGDSSRDVRLKAAVSTSGAITIADGFTSFPLDERKSVSEFSTRQKLIESYFDLIDKMPESYKTMIKAHSKNIYDLETNYGGLMSRRKDMSFENIEYSEYDIEVDYDMVKVYENRLGKGKLVT